MKSLGILITYFNEKEMLTECLNSIFSQSVLPDEIWIYDDASSAPAEKYVQKEWPVKIIRGGINKGPSHGRNILLEASRSGYVHFHDADDLFMSNWCSEIKRVIDETNADLILTEIETVIGSNIISDKVLGLDRLKEIHDLVKFCLKGSVLPSGSTIKRDAAVRVGGYRTKETLLPSEDFDFHVRLAASGARYAVISEPLIIKKLRADSHSKDKVRCWISTLKAVRLLSEELPIKHRQDLAEAAARAGSALFKLNAISEAEEAFGLAHRLGPPTFCEQKRLYRYTARILGPAAAERLSAFYRSAMPEKFRRSLKEKGW